ncbi:MAG: MFS transporter [Caulobacteraceae bacterium]
MSDVSRGAKWGELFSPDALPKFALVMLGTWLTAADTLVTITMMPTIAREIGGFHWFGWTVAAFVLGSILAGATSGRLAMQVGLRNALLAGGLVYAVGCGLSALAPDIGLFLLGRAIQGMGGGWTSGLCYVAVTALFEQRFWARVLSALAGAWGVATLVSPFIGGVFAEIGQWRLGFWLFAAQGLLFMAISWVLVREGVATEPAEGRTPWVQILVLAAAIAAIAGAGVVPGPLAMAALAIGGVVLFGLFLVLDARAVGRLLPFRTTDLSSAEGLGLFTVFAFCAATVGFNTYGPAMMQALHGASPVVAGYVMVTEAMAWTVMAFVVSGVKPEKGALPVRLGAVLLCAGFIAVCWVTPHGPLWAIALAASVQGSGFGLMWAIISSRIVAGALATERALASSAIPTLQLVGNAVGAAGCALVANGLGLADQLGSQRARTEGLWLYAVFIPVALAGLATAWKLADRKYAPTDP